MKKKLSIIFVWLLSVVLASVYVHENPELIENMKCNQKLHFSNGEKGCYDDLKNLLRKKKKNTKIKSK